jgi:ornithine decarboxylase
MEIYKSAAELIRTRAPDNPVLGVRPHAAERAARYFQTSFPGKVLYAVKANNAPFIVETLYQAGIRDFDVASLPELAQVAQLSGVTAHVMHPIKSRKLIAEAYFDYGVRTFALDCEAELEKILDVTGNANDLTLVVRVACPSTYSEVPLEGKFGVPWREAPDLLRSARQVAEQLGLSFHVGSQAMSPTAYGQALRSMAQHIVQACVFADVIDVGGGFPSCYPGLEPQPLDAYMSEIEQAFERMSVGWGCSLWAEPGRALAAEAESLIVKVEGRKGGTLYVNDGAFGALFDATHLRFVFPARGLRKEDDSWGENDTPLTGFSLYGPTCDSMDHMAGPFMLPEDAREGDYIEIGNIGAYGRVMAGHFNGFGYYDEAGLEDEPMLSMYRGDQETVAAEALA